MDQALWLTLGGLLSGIIHLCIFLHTNTERLKSNELDFLFCPKIVGKAEVGEGKSGKG